MLGRLSLMLYEIWFWDSSFPNWVAPEFRLWVASPLWDLVPAGWSHPSQISGPTRFVPQILGLVVNRRYISRPAQRSFITGWAWGKILLHISILMSIKLLSSHPELTPLSPFFMCLALPLDPHLLISLSTRHLGAGPSFTQPKILLLCTFQNNIHEW